MLPPEEHYEEYHLFADETEALEYLRSIKYIPKTKGLHQFYYEGFYTDHCVLCDVIGYVNDHVLIIKIGEERHCIHQDYLSDMQKGKETLW